MTDLTDYDREIVAAAERWVNEMMKFDSPLTPLELFRNLRQAVQAKRDAQRPGCYCCNQPSTKMLLDYGSPGPPSKAYRCDEHRIEVREL